MTPSPLPQATTLQILQHGRERIEKGWCRTQLALSAKRNPVNPDSILACAWCASGAISMDPNALEALRQALPPDDVARLVTRFNDAQEDSGPVLALFDRAIVMAGG